MTRSCQKSVRYVKGGLCNPGDGSKCHPYNSLSQAQADNSWTTLIVLPSNVALEGNLILQDGQNIEGLVDPTKVGNHKVGILTTLLGNTITTLGNNKISNLRFENIDHIAIEVTEGQNVCINNVFITNFNLGNYFEFSFWESAAIQGFQNVKSGILSIQNSIIENGTSGIQFSAAGNSIRKMKACGNTVRNLNAEVISIGIGGGANENATIYDIFHNNFIENVQSELFGAGLWGTSAHLLPEEGGTLFIDWQNNTLQDIGNTSSGFLWTLFMVNEGSANSVVWKVKKNYLNRGVQATLFQFENTGATAKVSFKKNRIDNHTVGGYNHYGSDEVVEACGNTFNNVDLGAFSFLSNNEDGANVVAKIFKNQGSNITTLGTLNIENYIGQWNNLNITYNCNCFANSDIAISDLTTGENNILVTARKNGFTNVPVSVLLNPGSATLDLQSNYWGGGPANVVQVGEGTATVDVSNFLTVNPCCNQPITPLALATKLNKVGKASKVMKTQNSSALKAHWQSLNK